MQMCRIACAILIIVSTVNSNSKISNIVNLVFFFHILIVCLYICRIHPCPYFPLAQGLTLGKNCNPYRGLWIGVSLRKFVPLVKYHNVQYFSPGTISYQYTCCIFFFTLSLLICCNKIVKSCSVVRYLLISFSNHSPYLSPFLNPRHNRGLLR